MTARGCAPDELPALIAAATRVFAPETGDMGRAYPLLFADENRARLRVVTEGGSIVAHAGYVLREAIAGGTRARVAFIGAVFTVEERRGQGLASRAVADAVACARAEGAAAALVSGAGPLYERAGFTAVPPAVATRAAPCGDPALAASPADAADVDVLAALYDAEPVRFVRAPEDWRRLLAARVAFWRAGQVWVVRRAGVAVAYAAIEDGARAGGARAVEVGGDRVALVDGLAPELARRGTATLEIVGAPEDEGTARAAAARGWGRGGIGFPWSVARWGLPAAVAVPWYGLDYV